MLHDHVPPVDDLNRSYSVATPTIYHQSCHTIIWRMYSASFIFHYTHIFTLSRHVYKRYTLSRILSVRTHLLWLKIYLYFKCSIITITIHINISIRYRLIAIFCITSLTCHNSWQISLFQLITTVYLLHYLLYINNSGGCPTDTPVRLVVSF